MHIKIQIYLTNFRRRTLAPCRACRSLRARGVPVPEIAARLVILTGQNKGRHPCLASVYRVMGEDGEN